MTTSVSDALVERLKVAFAASLMNANAGMRWLDYDSMGEMIESAWVGFEDAAIAALQGDTPHGGGK